MKKFKVEEKIYLNGELKQNGFIEYNRYKEAYEETKGRMETYLSNILTTEEIEVFEVNGNGISFCLKDSYYINGVLTNEEINIKIIEE